jgi:hypothetical protein
MMSATTNENAASSAHDARNAFLQWLNSYKELVSVVVFFLGGFLWVYGVFATKEQIKELKCVLNANVDMLNAQFEESSISQLLIENLQEKEKFTDIREPSDGDRKKAAQLITANIDLQKKLERATALRAETTKKLRSHQCID